MADKNQQDLWTDIDEQFSTLKLMADVDEKLTQIRLVSGFTEEQIIVLTETLANKLSPQPEDVNQGIVFAQLDKVFDMAREGADFDSVMTYFETL